MLHSWLMDLHFEEYFPLFASAGYDMPTICRMTPEVGSFCADVYRDFCHIFSFPLFYGGDSEFYHR